MGSTEDVEMVCKSSLSLFQLLSSKTYDCLFLISYLDAGYSQVGYQMTDYISPPLLSMEQQQPRCATLVKTLKFS